ncbi:phosphatase PAP2 family protein [Geodermatophilus sp. URMC 64]
MTARSSAPSRQSAAPPVQAGPVAVRLGITLVVLFGLTLGIGWLLTRAKEGDAFEQRDGALVQWFAAHRTGFLDAASGPAAELGNTWVVVGVGVVAAIAAWFAFRSWRPVVVLAVALCGELAIFLTTVSLIDRPRPPVPHLDAQLPPTSSFPSGHTAAAICLYGAVAALVVAAARGGWRRWVPVLAVLVVLVVAAARLYRGAHYPTDVLASALFAVPWLFMVLRALPLPPRRGAGVEEWRT